MNNKILYILSTDKFFLSHFSNRAIAANKEGFQSVVIAEKTSDKAAEEISELGIKFIDANIKRKSINIIKEIIGIITLKDIILKERPTICHNFGAKSIFYCSIALLLSKFIPSPSKFNSPRIINNLIGLGYVYSSNKLKAKLLRSIVSLGYRLFLDPGNNGKIICENHDDLNRFIANKSIKNTSNFICIPGAGVDTSLYSPIPITEKEKNFTVVMCCRLIVEKGVKTYIEAAKIIKEKSLPIEMWLAGSLDPCNPNSLEKEDLEEISKNKLIKYLGFIEDTSKIIRKAHVCCLPSIYGEGLPLFLIEGASCGLPIITTDNVGCRESVINNNGILIPKSDPISLANAIERLYLSPDLCTQMGKSSRDLAISRFDQKFIVAQTIKIYKELLF